MPKRSGRYPYGSGERPYQHDSSLIDNSQIQKYASENLKNADISNLDKFGSDKDHNILYILGISGSGKSTVALSFANDGTNIIHLDSYFELRNKAEAKKNQNKELNSFFNKNGFDYKKLGNEELFKTDIKKYFTYVDEFERLTEEFGKDQYNKQKKVVMEGVELNDETLHPDKTFFDDKPVIRLKTDEKLSRERAAERDLKHSYNSGIVQANELLEYIGVNRSIEADEIAHEGKKRRSGRYPFGSGKRPFQGVSKGLARKLKKKAKQGKSKEPEEKKPKTISEMTDDEIKAKIERLKLEQALSQLMPKEPVSNPNQELKDRVERLRLERDLKDLTAVKAPEKSASRKFIEKVGSGILEKSLDNIGTQGLTYFLGTAINKAANKRDEKGNLIEIVNPRKGQKDKS